MTDTIEQLISLRVNGVRHELVVPPRRTLSDVLRHDLGLTGTHVGCEHGICGACTVIVDGVAARSCLLLAVQVENAEVETVEGLAGPGGEPHPLQRAFHEHRAQQCGFCTPGFLMLAAAALREDRELSEDELVELLASNVCRCTGYDTIIAAVGQVFDERYGREGPEDKADR